MNIEDKLPPNTAAVVLNTGDEILRAVGYIDRAELQVQRDPIYSSRGMHRRASAFQCERWLELRMLVQKGDVQRIVDFASDAAPVQQSVDDAKGDDRLDNDDTKRLTE